MSDIEIKKGRTRKMESQTLGASRLLLMSAKRVLNLKRFCKQVNRS